MKHDLATKETERRLRQEVEKQEIDETMSAVRAESEISENLKTRINCNTLKLETGKLFEITKI